MKINNTDNLPHTFLGANSYTGFCSHFGECFSAEDGYKVFILKGGPGTGKSTLMKKIGEHFYLSGERVELCPCSSDPNSLDGVIIESKKAVVLDGTSPHIVEPQYPGVCEKVINLFECDGQGFLTGGENIIKVTKRNKAFHRLASGYLRVIGESTLDNENIAKDCTNIPSVKAYAGRLCKRLCKKQSNGIDSGRINYRFLSGVTPEGTVYFDKTVPYYAKNVIGIDDKYGAVSTAFLQTVADFLKENNIGAIIGFNPIIPTDIDRIIIPSMSIAFCRQYGNCTDKCTRKIHISRFTDREKLKLSKNRISFNNRIVKEAYNEAVSALKKAKSVHDRLEEYYINSVNFGRINRITNDIINQIEYNV